MISFVCLSETELSSEESSCERVGASSSQVHRRHGKRPQQPSLLSSLGSCSESYTHVNSDGDSWSASLQIRLSWCSCIYM